MRSGRSLFVAAVAIVVSILVSRQLTTLSRSAGPTRPTMPPPLQTIPNSVAGLPTSFPLTLNDMEGRLVTLPAPPKRIVSIAPSSTEILFALGLNNEIIAECTACDFPPAAASKPRVGGFSDLSVEKILAFNPDLVVADGFINPGILSKLEAARVRVFAIKAHTVAQAYDAIRALGRATGQNQEAERVVTDMQARMDRVRQSVSHAITRPRVLIAYGTDPIYTTGSDSFISDLIAAAGGRNIVDSSDQTISPEQVIVAEPDVIICDTGLVDRIKRMPGWAENVPAVKNSAYFSVSEAANMVRTGPRLALAAEELARFLHPELFTSDGKPASLAAPGKP